jgi:CRISPR/Cas system CSM-associated protein Csm3 (group 7 of RAMP superfamily)
LVKVTLERVTSRWADGQGIQSKDDLAKWQRRIATDAQWQAPGHPYRFTLRGDAAFLVSAGPEASSQISDATQQGRQGRSNMIRALRRRNNEPELPGSSLMGALRARAEWLAGLRNLRGIPGHEKDAIHIAEIFGLRADQMEDSQLMKALADRLDVQPIQITGLAGRLRLRRITPQKAEVVELASVRLDRFTQAPMDGALFATEAFVMPCFEVDLQLSQHPCDACDAELRRWVRRLIRHIGQRGAVEEGIMLGHGRNRGFGWFTLSEGP